MHSLLRHLPGWCRSRARCDDENAIQEIFSWFDWWDAILFEAFGPALVCFVRYDHAHFFSKRRQSKAADRADPASFSLLTFIPDFFL
jgi:hypothetical protein